MKKIQLALSFITLLSAFSISDTIIATQTEQVDIDPEENNHSNYKKIAAYATAGLIAIGFLADFINHKFINNNKIYTKINLNDLPIPFEISKDTATISKTIENKSYWFLWKYRLNMHNFSSKVTLENNKLEIETNFE